jgi:hypothetical protein
LHAGRTSRLSATILGPHDFVVIVRSRRQRGTTHAAGAWAVAGIAEDAALAEAMVALIMSANPKQEARALSHAALFHKVAGADRDRIVELLDSRTTADIARGAELRRDAQAWLATTEAPLSRSASSDASTAALDGRNAVVRRN